ncbi:amidase [Motilibacter aurantiacus]|uniref:amidase n=1 Tax=Motilibacter aurantiacus TaxID=2714955 RepID=UPI002F2B7305
MHSSSLFSTRRKGLTGLAALGLAASLVAPATATAAPAPAPALLSPAAVAQDVVSMGVAELQALLKQGKVTSVQLVQAYLDRIQAYENAYGSQPGVNAVIATSRTALAEARRLDAERKSGKVRGALHGIPILVKDNYDTGDMPTTSASEALEDFRPADDATQVAKLRAAGAIVVAKTNLHEYAAGITSISSLGGQTRNPFDQTRNPGGSSGGTGAGIAASFGAIGLGSDSCGSIRIPAAQNSLVGLRPSLGLSSRDGIAPMSATQDVGGPIGKSVRDVALVMDATAGYDPKDPVTASSIGQVPKSYTSSLQGRALKGKRVGLLTDLLGTTPDEMPTTTLVRQATKDMARAGAYVLEVPGQPELVRLIGASGVIADEMERDLNRYLAQPGARFDKALAARVAPADKLTIADIVDSGEVTPSVLTFLRSLVGTSGPDDAYTAKLLARQQLQQLTRELMEAYDLDALVYPTIKQVARTIGEAQPGSNCGLSAQTGFPALTVPAGLTPGGMPVGVELLGLPFSEPTLLGMGYSYEQLTKHHALPASTPALRR